MTHLSRHFSLAELSRHDPDPPLAVLANLGRLAEALEVIRERTGPIKVTSGYRPPEANRRAGGAKHSTHLLGLAADFRALRAPWTDARRLHELVLDLIAAGDLPDGGVGYYPAGPDRPRGRVHYDLGRAGRRWTA